MKSQSPLRGFSLIEVMIALAIMALALLVLVSVLVTGMKAQSKNERLMVADALGERIFDRTALSLRKLSEEEAVKFWEEKKGEVPEKFAKGQETVGNTQFSYEISAESVMNNTGGSPFGTAGKTQKNELKILQVTVRWRDDSQNSGSGVGLGYTSTQRLLNRHP